MFKYILDNLESHLKNIKSLKEHDIDHELEIRFGAISSRFNSNLGKETFDRIYSTLMTNEDNITEQTITDLIFDKNVSSTFLKRKLNFSEKFMKKEIINDKTKEKEIEYMIKDNKDKYTYDHLRLSVNTEKIIGIEKYKDVDVLHDRNKPYEIVRQKKRFSRPMGNYFRLDMTEAKTLDKRMRVTGNTDYIVELELIKLPENFEEARDEIRGDMTTIVNLYYNKMKYFFNIGTMNPQTLEKKDMTTLKKQQYSLTDKADGERMFLIFINDDIHLYNPKTQETRITFPNPTEIKDTIIDGEYLEKYGEFLSFDLLFSTHKGKFTDYRIRNLDKRLDKLYQLRNQLDTIKELKVLIKKFYMFDDDIFLKAKDLWLNRKKYFKYELDGLIFTPIEQIYTSSKQQIPVLKWKEHLSIDVRVEYNFRENRTYFHHGSGNPGSKEWNIRIPPKLQHSILYREKLRQDIKHLRWVTGKPNIINNLGTLNLGIVKNNKLYLGIDGIPSSGSKIKQIWSKYDIVEYEYSFDKNQWIAIRKRTFDKESPNAYKTIESVVRSIINYIGIEDIYKLHYENIENVGELYNLTTDLVARKKWRVFNNFVKNKLYAKVSDIKTRFVEYHLEFACGKGGDIKKWIENGYKNILAIDSSRDEIYGKNGMKERLFNMGFKNKDYYMEKNDVRVTFIWGDISKNIRKYEALGETDSEKLKKFFENLPATFTGFDSISIMFAIHYLYGKQNPKGDEWVPDKEKFDGFRNNITQLLKYDGILFGTYLNGNNIKDDMKFVYAGDVMYEINHIVNKKIEYKNFWKQKEINTINIKNEVWGKNVEISEPKIDKQIITDSFGEKDFQSIVLDTSFEQFYDDFVDERKTQLVDSEKDLCFINNIFIMCRINIEEFMVKINELLDINIMNKEKLMEYLIENLENGNLDDKVKQIYKLLN